MPPRKKARVSQATSPDPASQPKTPTPAAPSPTHHVDVLNDPWTDDEEIGLFKGLMRWKPTGIHKHFRLIALHQWLLSNGYIHPRNAHTRPAGIWAKLRTLYDLSALDAREDARQLARLENPLLKASAAKREESSEEADDASAYSEAANKIDIEEFDLSRAIVADEQDNDEDGGFAALMWKRRLASEKDEDESEPELSDLNLMDAPPVRFTPSFSIEPSEAATPASSRPSRGRGGGARGARGGRGGMRRSARQAESVAGSATEERTEESAKEEVQEVEDSAEEDEDGSDEDEDEDEESQASTPAPRSARGARTGTRGRPPARGRGRGRPKR